jgi:hypothetical protein
MTNFRLHDEQNGKRIKDNSLSFRFPFVMVAYIYKYIYTYTYIDRYIKIYMYIRNTEVYFPLSANNQQ